MFEHAVQHITDEMRRCIDLCQRCHAECLATVSHCLLLGEQHAAQSHINTLLDCAATCATSADLMLRGSQMHARMCGVCAVACDRCAQSCEMMAGGDQQMLDCAA
ncbi:MAG: four-helix bundle copper-binding protein, partial [Chloroflexota bacterium]|nr:four-helix bundle copper-binding protein [Chloroflexota bacterium]